jgi:hypothetical protein
LVLWGKILRERTPQGFKSGGPVGMREGYFELKLFKLSEKVIGVVVFGILD